MPGDQLWVRLHLHKGGHVALRDPSRRKVSLMFHAMRGNGTETCRGLHHEGVEYLQRVRRMLRGSKRAPALPTAYRGEFGDEMGEYFARFMYTNPRQCLETALVTQGVGQSDTRE